MNWILPAYFTCAAVIIGLLVILNDLGRDSNWVVRIILYITMVCYLTAGLAIQREVHYMLDHADAVVFSGVGVLIITVVLYIAFQQYHISVLRYSGGAMLVSILLLIVGSCSDKQANQIPTHPHVTAIIHRH